MLNSTIPANSEDPKLGARRMREIKEDVQVLLAKDHHIDTVSGDVTDDADTALHDQVTLVKEYDPAGVLPDNALFKGTDGEMYFKAAGQAVVKLTEAGSVPNVFVPAGSVNAFAGAAAPSGWLLCDGLPVSRTTYADLFTAIGTTFGVGDGSTTFNLPDLRGRAPIGAGTGTGLTARTPGQEYGAETHTLTEAEMPSHGVHGAGEHSIGNAQFEAGRLNAIYSSTTKGGGGAHNNMQPSLALNFIIKT